MSKRKEWIANIGDHTEVLMNELHFDENGKHCVQGEVTDIRPNDPSLTPDNPDYDLIYTIETHEHESENKVYEILIYDLPGKGDLQEYARPQQGNWVTVIVSLCSMQKKAERHYSGAANNCYEVITGEEPKPKPVSERSKTDIIKDQVLTAFHDAHADGIETMNVDEILAVLNQKRQVDRDTIERVVKLLNASGELRGCVGYTLP